MDNYWARKCNVPPVERAVGPNVLTLRLNSLPPFKSPLFLLLLFYFYPFPTFIPNRVYSVPSFIAMSLKRPLWTRSDRF